MLVFFTEIFLVCKCNIPSSIQFIYLITVVKNTKVGGVNIFYRVLHLFIEAIKDLIEGIMFFIEAIKDFIEAIKVFIEAIINAMKGAKSGLFY